MKLNRSQSVKLTFAERAKRFSDNFNVLFLSTITTIGIIISLVSLLVAEYTRVTDGLAAIFPNKVYFIISFVSIGLLVSYINAISLNAIEQYENEQYKEYKTNHSLRSFLMSIIRRLFGKSTISEVTTTTKIISRKHLLELGIITFSISGNLIILADSLFGGNDVPIAQAWSYLLENITFNQLLDFGLIFIFSFVVIFVIEPFVVYVIHGGLRYRDSKAEKIVDAIVEKYSSMGYKKLNIISYETRVSLEPLFELDRDYNLLYRLNKKDKKIMVANVDSDTTYEVDYSNANREKSIALLKEKLNESK